MSSNSEKFLSTYGKNISFEKTPITEQDPSENLAVTKSFSIKKYISLITFVAITLSLFLLGGIFIIGFAVIFIVGYLLRIIFGGPNSNKSFYIVKK